MDKEILRMSKDRAGCTQGKALQNNRLVPSVHHSQEAKWKKTWASLAHNHFPFNTSSSWNEGRLRAIVGRQASCHLVNTATSDASYQWFLFSVTQGFNTTKAATQCCCLSVLTVMKFFQCKNCFFIFVLLYVCTWHVNIQSINRAAGVIRVKHQWSTKVRFLSKNH